MVGRKKTRFGKQTITTVRLLESDLKMLRKEFKTFQAALDYFLNKFKSYNEIQKKDI